MKKLIAQEFLWLLIALVLSVPLAFLFLVCLDLSTGNTDFSETEKIFIIQLFLIGFAISFVGIYLMRFIVAALKTMAKGEE